VSNLRQRLDLPPALLGKGTEMDAGSSETARCPAGTGRDDRKSAAMAASHVRPEKGARIAENFAFAREILRSPDVRQSGAGAEQVVVDNPAHISFFFLDGELHQRRRGAVASYFAPKTIVTRYHPIMHRTIDALIADLQARKSAPLDEMSFQMAVDVAAEIIGLTDSESRMALARRIRRLLGVGLSLAGKTGASRFFGIARMAYYSWVFCRKDLDPAVAARRAAPREDVISYMIKEGYSKKAMLIECLTYGSAGMMTTREFIVMAAWHVCGDAALKQRFLDGGEADQFAILEEILRLEPVAAMLHRRAVKDIATTKSAPVPAGELLAIDIRRANSDEAIVGACPFQLDPDRAKRMKTNGSYLSFGDGPHRCPGSQVALHETRIFLDRLLRVPGFRLASEPTISWNSGIQGYELRGAIAACD
jgi:cytochrome P450